MFEDVATESIAEARNAYKLVTIQQYYFPYLHPVTI